MLTAVVFAPLAVLLGQVLARDGLQIVPSTTTIGVLAAAVQFLGLARWPFLVPALARAYDSPDSSPATRDATAVVFDAFNRYLGVAVGECLGYLLTGAWTVLVGAAMLQSSTFDAWLAWLGIAVGAFLVARLARVRRQLRGAWVEAGRDDRADRLYRLVALARRHRHRAPHVNQPKETLAMVTIPLAPVDAVRITILMDNVTDPLLFPRPRGSDARPGSTTSGGLGWLPPSPTTACPTP